MWKTSKSVTIYKTNERRQLKIGSKNRWSHNTLTVLIAFRKKKDMVKLNSLKSLGTIAIRTLYKSDDFVHIFFKI